MATALIQGFLRAGLVRAENVAAADPSADARTALTSATGIRVVDDNLAVAQSADVLILAIKPRDLPTVLAQLRGRLGENVLVVSIVAGARLATLAEGLGPHAHLARVMPNTPCVVGQGASGFCLGPGATGADRDLVECIFGAVGLAVEVDERLLDAVTGLSGSGPAFAYLVIEALAEGGVQVGLSRDAATRLAAQTLRGAAEMVVATGEAPETLKNRVTSPGGTTLAGLQVLESAGVPASFAAAVEAATRRSIELGTQSRPGNETRS